MPNYLAYARLARPANLPTAAADILAGAAAAGLYVGLTPLEFLLSPVAGTVGLLVLASVCLYAGGVVLNDVFDHETDAVERPERPIPSGRVPLTYAAIFGCLLLNLGVVLAFSAGWLSGMIAFLLAGCIVLYDAISEASDFWSPLAMGSCRGLNLLLGISAAGALTNVWLALLPVAYIFAITLISRGEVKGGDRGHIVLAGGLYGAVILALVALGAARTGFSLLPLVYAGVFGWMVLDPLVAAYHEASAANVKRAVIAGVQGLVLMDATLTVAFASAGFGACVVFLLVLSFVLSRVFAVS